MPTYVPFRLQRAYHFFGTLLAAFSGLRRGRRVRNSTVRDKARHLWLGTSKLSHVIDKYSPVSLAAHNCGMGCAEGCLRRE